MILQLLLTLLLCSLCLTNLTPNVDLNNNAPQNGAHQNTPRAKFLKRTTFNELGVNRTTFDDLVEDVVFIIFGFMNIPGLLHMAEINAKYESIASLSFRWKYRDFEIQIWQADSNGEEKFRIETRKKVISIDDYYTALGILQHFGNSIRKLRINHSRMQNNHSAMLNHFIASSESIMKLKFDYIRENTLAQFTSPLKAVEDFSCYMYTGDFIGNILPFDQLFPKLKKLMLTLFSDLDYSFIDCHFPHLEHFGYNIGNSPVQQRMKLVESIMTKNPQIKSIDARFATVEFVKTIADLLPNVTNLTLFDFEIKNRSVHFENVQNFKADSLSAGSIDKLTFSSLESVEIKYDIKKFDKWVAFFKQNPQIRRLYLNFFDTISDEQLVGLISELPGLTEMKWGSYGSFNTRVISRVIQRLENLMKFEFSLNIYNEEDVDNFCKQFENEWHVARSPYGNGILLVKRISIEL